LEDGGLKTGAFSACIYWLFKYFVPENKQGAAQAAPFFMVLQKLTFRGRRLLSDLPSHMGYL
jgi:hypothetical protein